MDGLEAFIASGGKSAVSAPKGSAVAPSSDDPMEQFIASGGAAGPSKWVPDSAPIASPSEKSGEADTRTWAQRADEKLTGAGEAALTLATGAVAAPIAAAAGLFRGFTGGHYGTQEGTREAQARAAEVQQSLTYQPRGEVGQEIVGGISKALDASKLGGLGPPEMVALSSVMAGPKMLPKPAPSRPVGAPQMASAGASAASTAQQVEAMVSRASPELQAVVKKIGPAKVNPEVLERHIEAESLPVPMQLTRGQATQDTGLLSTEQNLRGKHEQIRNRFADQNTKLIENTNAIRENAAPDVYATTNPEIGQMVIDSYAAKDAAANAKISAAYKALTDANGGAFPLDGVAFVDAADKALHKELLFDHVSASYRKTLDRLRDGQSMTFENFESLRTNLARTMRSSADGNEKAAAGVIRQALEDLPMPAGAEHLKPLADAARSLAKERFAAIKKDPAYKAVVDGTASADKFIEKYLIKADLKNVETMKGNLDGTAQQALAAGTMNHLKRNAGIIENSGNFSQAGYNKALEAIRSKLGVIFQPTERQQVEALGRVARYTQAQPRGSFVNNSNTLTAAVAERAKGAAEVAANMAVPGAEIGTRGRRVASRFAEKNELNKTLQSGAGIRLKDIAK
jgi:hypothetical protein